MTDPDQQQIQRLTRRVDSLSRELRELRGTVQHTRASALLRAVAIGVLVLTTVPWLSYTDTQADSGDPSSALGLVRRGSEGDDRVLGIAAMVLVVAVVVALFVPVERRFSWISGAAAVVAVLVVLNAKPEDTGDTYYHWTAAPTLCLFLTIVVLAVQASTARAEVATPTRH